MKRPFTHTPVKKYSKWFYAAAIYNLIWGIIVILWPNFLFDLFGIPQPTDMTLWQVVGMLVMVYAPAYWWTAQNPEGNYQFIMVGLLGKLCGPIGFVWAVGQGQLPLSFGWIILFNDLIWWPAFISYLHTVWQLHGLKPMLSGE